MNSPPMEKCERSLVSNDAYRSVGQQPFELVLIYNRCRRTRAYSVFFEDIQRMSRYQTHLQAFWQIQFVFAHRTNL